MNGARLSTTARRFVAFASRSASATGHGHGRGEDSGGSRFTQPGVQGSNLLLLTRLQGLDLYHVLLSEAADFLLEGLVLGTRVVVVAADVTDAGIRR
jgi:hypothetical protein